MGDPEAVRLATALIAAENTMVLATADGDGTPRIAPLFYWCEGLNLFWLSAEDARHSRNLGTRERASVAVYAPVNDWKKIRGVQMEGSAAPVYDCGKRERVLDAYRRKFALGPELDLAIAGTTLYSFQPAWLRYMDNTRGFGFKIETELGQ